MDRGDYVGGAVYAPILATSPFARLRITDRALPIRPMRFLPWSVEIPWGTIIEMQPAHSWLMHPSDGVRIRWMGEWMGADVTKSISFWSVNATPALLAGAREHDIPVEDLGRGL